MLDFTNFAFCLSMTFPRSPPLQYSITRHASFCPSANHSLYATMCGWFASDRIPISLTTNSNVSGLISIFFITNCNTEWDSNAGLICKFRKHIVFHTFIYTVFKKVKFLFWRHGLHKSQWLFLFFNFDLWMKIYISKENGRGLNVSHITYFEQEHYPVLQYKQM